MKTMLSSLDLDPHCEEEEEEEERSSARVTKGLTTPLFSLSLMTYLRKKPFFKYE